MILICCCDVEAVAGDIVEHVAVAAHCAVPGHYPSQKLPYRVRNDIPPRLEWDGNYGYCGETSFISAGLYYGQYISQFEARHMAYPGRPQRRRDSQLFVDDHGKDVATRMHLAYSYMATDNHKAFLVWLKNNISHRHPVVIGVYSNVSKFSWMTPPGDPDYDHIIPVLGIDSKAPIKIGANGYFGDDRIIFSDNGLYAYQGKANPTFYYSYAFGEFLKSRRQANLATSPVYSLPNDTIDYGIAFTGVIDLNSETRPVRVATNLNCEWPVITDGTSSPPKPMPLTLAVTVSQLTPGQDYVLYEYDNMSKVPNQNFNANADMAAHSWSFRAAAGTHTIALNIQSNQIAVFRAVVAP